jgi:DNA mismatch repair protein MSH5
LGHVIAAIDMKDYGTVGCAYYSAEEEKLYLLGDSRSGGMEAIDACKSYLLVAYVGNY